MVALQQALTQLQADWLWLLGCDLPQLQPEILRRWIDQLDELPDTCLVSVPRTPGGWEPLCGFYRPTVLPHLEAFINQGGRSFQNWLDDVPHHTITVGDGEAQILYNCNTLEDLAGQA
jgi:molybdopterin-guanine dinucleotide biosynthesis protein A